MRLAAIAAAVATFAIGWMLGVQAERWTQLARNHTAWGHDG